MRRIASGFATAYGAHPLHLLSLLASFALAGYATVKLVPQGFVGVAVWFVGAAIVHDVVLLPLYGLVDRGLLGVWRHRRTRAEALPAAPWLNYVRLPLGLSALCLLVFLPSIFELSGDSYVSATGLSTQPYLGNWLLVTAVLFGLSALAYAVRLRRTRTRHHRRDPPDHGEMTGE